MGYEVKEASTRRDVDKFVKLPFKIYENDKLWIPPLISEVKKTLNAGKNPYFKNASLKLFICFKDDRVVSRIVIIINKRHEKRFGIKSAIFGFLETFNDNEAVKLLFDEVESYCRENNVKKLEGPFNPNHYSELGMQTNNFDLPVNFFQTYNPYYYNKLLKENGFRISSSVHTRTNKEIRKYIYERYGDKNLLSFPRGFSIRDFRLNKLETELEYLREIYNDAFDANHYFIPVSKEEYLFTAKHIKLVTYPNLIQFVEYEGKPVGVVQCVLNVNPLLKKLNGRVGPVKYLRYLQERKNVRDIIIYAVGIKKEFQRTSVFKLLLGKMIEIAKEYDVCRTTWMSSDNLLAVKAAERLGMQPDKEFAIYEKLL